MSNMTTDTISPLRPRWARRAPLVRFPAPSPLVVVRPVLVELLASIVGLVDDGVRRGLQPPVGGILKLLLELATDGRPRMVELDEQAVCEIEDVLVWAEQSPATSELDRLVLLSVWLGLRSAA